MENINDTLSLFDNINVDNKRRISDEDKQYCEEQQRYFERTMNQIRNYQLFFQQCLEKERNPVYKVRYNEPVLNDNFSNPYFTKKSISDDELYRASEFSPLFPLKGCQKCYEKTITRFETKVVDYFNRKYGCRFEEKGIIMNAVFPQYTKTNPVDGHMNLSCPGDWFALIGKETKFPSYELILDYIMDELGGLSFREKKDDLALDSLRKILSYHNVELKRNTVKVTNFIYFNEWSDYRIRYDDVETIETIIETERAVNGADKAAKCGNISELHAGEELAICGNGTSLVSMKLFKNGNLLITFATDKAAEKFFNFCKQTDR